MKKLNYASIGLLLVLWATAQGAAPQRFIHSGYGADLKIEVWNDRGNGAVYQPGEPITLYFRSNHDCYVTLYNIDTEGRVHLLYPYNTYQSNFIAGGMTYAIPDGWNGFQFVVNGSTGMEYISAVATYAPHPVPNWLWVHPSFRMIKHSGHRQFERITYDPYLAMDDIAARIAMPCAGHGFYVQDFFMFYVSAPVYYPRYLCNNCHGHRRYRPYHDVCVNYQIWVDVDWNYKPIYLRKRHPRGFWKYRKRSKPYRVHSRKDRTERYSKKSYRRGQNNIATRRYKEHKNPALTFKRPKNLHKTTSYKNKDLDKRKQLKKPAPKVMQPKSVKPSKKKPQNRHYSKPPARKYDYNKRPVRKNEIRKVVIPDKKMKSRNDSAPAKKKESIRKPVPARQNHYKSKSRDSKRSNKTSKSRKSSKKDTRESSSKKSKKAR